MQNSWNHCHSDLTVVSVHLTLRLAKKRECLFFDLSYSLLYFIFPSFFYFKGLLNTLNVLLLQWLPLTPRLLVLKWLLLEQFVKYSCIAGAMSRELNRDITEFRVLDQFHWCHDQSLAVKAKIKLVQYFSGEIFLKSFKGRSHLKRSLFFLYLLFIFITTGTSCDQIQLTQL